MTELVELLPDAELLLDMEVEILAGYLLETLQGTNRVHPRNYAIALKDQYKVPNLAKVQAAVMEAWSWLLSECLLAPDPYEQAGWAFITRKGRKLKTAVDVIDLQGRALLKKELLHPSILQNAYSQFISGHYDNAVFQAFKEIEINIKESTGLVDDGVNLVRAAFRAANQNGNSVAGVLTDQELQSNEQEGFSHLLAGAFMWCRNPLGHRNVGLSRTEAAQLLIFASYLMDIIDKRSAVCSQASALD